MSALPPQAPARPGNGGTWRPLRLFILYRLVLVGLLLTLVVAGVHPSFLGEVNPPLFIATLVSYLVFAVAASFGARLHVGSFQQQVLVQVLVDIVAITILMYTSGGVRSGFGTLLVVAIAGGSILTVGRTALLFAAVATLALLAQEIFGTLYGVAAETAYTHAGILGATFFATAYLAHFLSARIRESERLALQRGVDLANLAALNQAIIQRMQSGVMALDAQDRVRLMNESARRLLEAGVPDGGTLGQVSPRLQERVAAWRRGRAQTSSILHPEDGEVDVIVSFAPLQSSPPGGVLIFLEDSSAVAQRAQELKLASLGRLAASIAHEIRNPLGAISHAAQLLAESPALDTGDQRLLAIIQEQSRRVNGIIENVHQLGRRRPHDPVTLDLVQWLPGYLEELRARAGLSAEDVAWASATPDLVVKMDESQLRQVVENLCDNALRYATRAPRLTLELGRNPDSERPHLDVYDSGPGVDGEAAEHLFEPFFTTERTGTGLGLYIARELCEVNQASLTHLGRTARGHGFRISFAHPQRQGLPTA